MVADLTSARKNGMDGVVIGLLNADRLVDIERTGELVESARPLPTTFHRAFDETPSARVALEGVIASAHDQTIAVELPGGRQITFPFDQVDRAHLRFEW